MQMPKVPDSVGNSRLWHKLDAHADLKSAVVELRRTAEFIGAKASEVVPEFTDHSIRHMDALWTVCDAILTPAECDRMSGGEAFVLACAFYVHDLGMAFGATAAGIESLRQSSNYESAFRRLTGAGSIDPRDADTQALRSAARELHAKKAMSFIDELLPGLDRYLIESKDIRDRWGAFIGEVSSSHHWSLREVDLKLGARGAVPDPLHGRTDLAFVACILRIVDYAHINFDRALRLDRALRSNVPPDSLLHWQAQENVTGPVREGHQIVYGCARPISSVAAWWTFFELARGLDSEIKDVAEFLAQRSASVGRFSLEGVRGASGPRQFAALVLTSGFEPIDVRVRSSSMDRLVALLGGKSLYGNDPVAAIRELIQNAADAVRLRRASEIAAGVNPVGGAISVTLDTTRSPAVLTVSDDGVGMSERVVTQYLLGVASDYWHSADFEIDHPGVIGAGFVPVGRFGIGFLSVFMLGRDISVQTQRTGEQALHLQLEGVGSRGAIERRPPGVRSGTTVEVKVEPEGLSRLSALASSIQARCPMLDMPISVRSGDSTVTLEPSWWKSLSQEEFRRFVVEHGRDQASLARERVDRFGLRVANDPERLVYLAREARNLLDDPLLWWPKSQPEHLDASSRVMAVPSQGKVVLCSRGFAVSEVHIPGFLGFVDLPDLQLNAARNRASLDTSELRGQLRENLLPRVLASMSDLNGEASIHDRYAFIVKASTAYGLEVLCDTELLWISVVTPPGDVRLLSAREFVAQIAEEDEIVIGYREVSPWTIAREARLHFPEASARSLRVLISGVGQAEIRRDEQYHERDEIKRMPLAHHLSVSYSSMPRDIQSTIPPMLSAIMSLIERGWRVPAERIAQLDWSSKQNVLCGHIQR